jgi:hypothetical protein
MNKSNNSANASFVTKFLKRMFNPEGKPELTLEYLIGIDAVQWAGFDAENDMPLYVFTEKIKEISPALYQERQTEVYKLTLDLWEKGFVEADWLSENPIIYLTDKSFEQAKLQGLSSPEKLFISELKRLTEGVDHFER